MISASNKQLQQELEYTLLKPDCHFGRTICNKIVLNTEKMPWKLDVLLWPRDQETEFPVEAGCLSQTQEGQTEQIHPQTFDDPFFDSTGMIYMHWVPTGQTANEEYYVEVLREFRKRLRRKRLALFKSSAVFPLGQCTSPKLHHCNRLFDQDGHQDSSSHSL